jgi:uncharacterized protein (TIGR00297 family)
MTLLARFALGIFLSALIAFAAYRRGSLSTSGAIGAMIVGTAIFGFGGWVWGLVLISFFVLSTLLSHYKESEKAGLAEKFAKGHQRDLGQTLANGGMGALLALGYWLFPHPALWAAFVGAMATVNADTWATELGVLSRKPPRLVTTWRVVERGASGGVSALGTLAALSGALAIGLAAWGLGAIDRLLGGPGWVIGWVGLILAAGVGGVTGSFADSLLGATVQAIYFCPTCKKETEKALHTCGTPTQQMRGWRWLSNDWVNFISSSVGALAAALLLLAAG